MESKSSNATHRMSLTISTPWRFHYYLNNIKASSSSHVSFSHVPQVANEMANDRMVPLVSPIV